MACCRFHGHRVKVLKMEPEFSHGEKKVQPRVQAEAVRLVKERGVAVAQRLGIWTCTRMCCANGYVICRPIRSMRFPATAK